MSKFDFEQWCEDLNLSVAARSLLREVRSSAPVRNPNGFLGNLCGSIAAKKTRTTQDTESVGEAAHLYLLQADPDVIEAYTQACRVKITHADRRGKERSDHIIPDITVLLRNEAGFISVKQGAEVKELGKSRPDEYQFDANQKRWRYIPGEKAAQAYGLFFRVHTEDDYPPCRLRNVQYLLDTDESLTDLSSEQKILTAVQESPGISLGALIEMELCADAELIYAMLIRKQIVTNLDRFDLYRHHSCPLFISQTVMSAALPTQNEPGEPKPFALDKVNPRLKHAEERHLQIALLRRDILDGRIAAPHISKRTIRRWKKDRREALLGGTNELDALIPQFHERGDRTPRFTKETIDLANAVIDKHLLNPKRKSITEAFGHFLLEKPKETPSYTWFHGKYLERPEYQREEARKGEAGAYTKKPFRLRDIAKMHRERMRPWLVAHIDSTLLDIHTRDEECGVNLGKPWVMALIDQYSGVILAKYISYDAPSAKSIMMLLRICVRKHGRLPRVVITDNGKEFKSIYYRYALARYECDILYRPKRQARFGGPIERHFKSMMQNCVYSLKGNTQNSKNPRGLSKTTDPVRNALWSLGPLILAIDDFHERFYHNAVHSELGVTPNQAFAHGLKMSGGRRTRRIEYEDDFYFSTLLIPRRSTGKVNSARGIQIENRYYWSSNLAKVEGKHVPLKYDPDVLGHIYAKIDGTWTPCDCSERHLLEGRSETEVAILTRKLRAVRTNVAKGRKYRWMDLAEMVRRFEKTEEVLEQRMKDRARRCAYHGVTGRPRTAQEAQHDAATATAHKTKEQPAAPTRKVTRTCRKLEDY